MTLESLKLLQRCLHMVTLDVNADDFEEVATATVNAKAELAAEIEQLEGRD